MERLDKLILKLHPQRLFPRKRSSSAKHEKNVVVVCKEEGGIERRTTLSKTKLPKGKQIHQASHVNDDSRGFFVESSQMIIKYLRSELVQTFT